jgi:hypothetical protein
MALPPIPADEPGYKISDSLRRWLQLLAQALGGLTVTNETITTTRTIIAETFEGALDGSHITGNIAYAQLPAGTGTWAASPSISGAVALGSTLDVTGLSTFGSHLVPSASEAYDLGSETKLWRKAFVSQMQATLFSKETQSLYGGWLAVTKNAGTFAAGVVPLATTVDFGQAMTANQFVLVRAVDRTGAISSEYMKVVSLSTGTTYNVTRDLAGTGAKDWPEGTPYAVRGVAGDGWVELNAFDTPRMSVFTQGSAYNNSVENIRIGHLAGMPNSSSGIGVYMGDSSNYFRWDGTNLKVIGADATLDNSGLTLGSNTVNGYLAGAALKYRRASASGYGTGTGDVFGAYTSSVNTGPQTDTLTIENTMVTPNNGGGFAANVGRALVSLVAKGWNTSGAGAAQPTASIDLDSGRAGLSESKITVTAQAVALTGTIAERGRTTPMGETDTYTPTWASTSGTPITVGNATLTGRYDKVGKKVTFSISFVFGSTSNAGVGNFFTFSLPSTAVSTAFGVFNARLLDSGTQWYTGLAGYLASTTTVAVLNNGATGSGIGAGSPITWATGDTLTIEGWYYEA